MEIIQHRDWGGCSLESAAAIGLKLERVARQEIRSGSHRSLVGTARGECRVFKKIPKMKSCIEKLGVNRMLRLIVLVVLGAFAAPLAWAGPPSDESPATDALQEVVVTATKQRANLQKVDAAVTVATADILVSQGVDDLPAAQKLVPSVRFQNEANNTQVVVRGVGSTLDLGNVQPLVAFNLAGIYVPREETSAGFFDLEQLEVLPGPQGTLYGRSAAGGTVNLTPTRPGFNTDGSALLEVGNYSAVHGTATQNIKASDTLAFRAAIDYNYHEGYMTTGSDSANDVSLRLSSLFNPSDALSVYLWTQGAGKYGYTPNLVNKGTNPNTGGFCEGCFLFSNPWNDTRSGKYAEPFGSPHKVANHFTSAIVGGQIDYRFDGATLTYLPSYLYLDSRPLFWLGAVDAQNIAHYNQISHELRLTSNSDGPLSWLGGLYYYNMRHYSDLNLFVNLPFSFTQDGVAADRLAGYAAFGQAKYSFTETIRGIVGGRFSSTDHTANGNEPAALGTLPYTFDKTFNHFDWKVGLEADVLSKAMVYGTIQTGYQPGTFNELPNTATFSNEIRPSTLRSYTAGLKSRWLDDRLQINDEVFYYDYRDLLTQSYDINAAYNPLFNARKVAIKGNQLDILMRVFTGDQVNVNVGYLHARDVEFLTPTGQNFAGYQLAYAPDLTAAAGYTHNMPVGNATLRAHIDWRYEGSWWGTFNHVQGTQQAKSNKGDAYLTYDATKWTLGVWIKNIQNRAVIGATAAAGVPGPATSYLEDPRTYGLRVTVNY
jgi:iron complex outermembrane receptor protein